MHALKIRKTGILLFVLAFFLTLSGVINCASAIAEPWSGTEINILIGDLTQTVSSSDYSYVAHGGYYSWSVLTGSQKADKMKAFWFELETDPTAFTGKLRLLIYYDRESDRMYRWWWIQFRPGDLTPGSYSFTGKWYDNYNLEIQRTITLIVT